MIQDRSLENRLAGVLRYGTLVASVTIAAGMVLNEVTPTASVPDLVTVGIVGFIVLPVLRLGMMLIHYHSTRDLPIFQVVAIVLFLVAAGLILGMML